ncbi:hypothetical protein [Ruminiclostridium cellobioparum]|uniref:hypothetical protein n=1 Tax=Ruminiclostridium cellobioparum TaxID=29355 RepID=UPI0004863EE5|nr:hypothetical protein [Ruminiclostridium cellobioparum]
MRRVHLRFSLNNAYITFEVYPNPNQEVKFLRADNLDFSLYDYCFVATHKEGVNAGAIFWYYEFQGTVGSYSPTFPEYDAHADNIYTFSFYKKLKNNVPTITITIPGNTILTEKDTGYIPQISVLDPNVQWTWRCHSFVK